MYKHMHRRYNIYIYKNTRTFQHFVWCIINENEQPEIDKRTVKYLLYSFLDVVFLCPDSPQIITWNYDTTNSLYLTHRY